MNPGALILADDLTGAADCGVQAVRRGLRTTVSLQAVLRGDPVPQLRRNTLAGPDVVAIDLDTRDGTEAVALERTRAAARGADETTLLYVKLDSRLRGHLGAAIDGALAGAGRDVALVAPAFPGQGRTTVGGHQCVDGEPVADLVERLRTQTTRRVTRVELAALRDGGLEIALAEDGGQVLACDAADDADLVRIVAAGRAVGRSVVWAGSAGLAAALFDGLPASAGALPAVATAPGGAVLVVVGSVAAASVIQLEALLTRPGGVAIAVDPVALIDSPTATAAQAEKAATAALAGGDDAIVHLTPGAPRLGREMAPRIADGLALATGPAVPLAAGLLLTGGETARALCDRAGLSAIELVAEVEPGVPLGHVGSPPKTVVTKSGAFGHPGTLTAALDAIKEHCACLTRS